MDEMRNNLFKHVVWLWALVLPLLLSGCTLSAEFQPLRVGSVPWQDGESSIYRVTDQEGTGIGSAQFDIRAGGETVDETGWTIRREIRAQGVQEIATVEVSAETLRPLTSTLMRTSEAGQESADSIYSSGQVDTELNSTQQVFTAVRYQVPTDARDQRTVLMLVRTLPLESGYATRINSYLPIAALLDRVEVNVTRREEVTVPAGTFDTWRVRLEAQSDETIIAWFGTDAPHPLIKFEDTGSEAVFELTEFMPGG